MNGEEMWRCCSKLRCVMEKSNGVVNCIVQYCGGELGDVVVGIVVQEVI